MNFFESNKPFSFGANSDHSPDRGIIILVIMMIQTFIRCTMSALKADSEVPFKCPYSAVV